MYKLNEISVVLIGKNEGGTILDALHAVKVAISRSFIEKFEILYVDSMSIDNTLEKIEHEDGVHIIKIVEGFVSASFGRYLGQKKAQYANILFLDGDMIINEDFLLEIQPYFNQYGAITAQVDNMYSDGHTSLNVFGLDSLGPLKRLGGFLLITKEIIGDFSFRPILKDEEELDFYAKFYSQNKVYGVPIKGVMHLDKKRTILDKLKYHFNPQNHFGWIQGVLFNIKEKRFIYLWLVLPYLSSFLGSIGFYGMFFYKPMLWLWLFSIPFGWSIGSGIVTSILLPWRIILALKNSFKKDLSAVYIEDNMKKKINIRNIG